MIEKKPERYAVLKELKNRQHDLYTKYGIKKMGIFGSVARDNANKNSDVDIVIEMEKPDLFMMVNIKEELETILGCKVDLIRYRRNMNLFLKNRIDKEALYV